MKVGEMVLAKQGPLLYDACVMELKSDDKCVIHYKGWNSKFDEVVKIKDLLPLSEENLRLKTNLEQYYSENRSVLPNVETQLQYLNRRSVDIELPLPLRARLADDFEAICRQKMLVPLPHKFPLENVMKRFASDAQPHKDLNEFCKGLIWYFDSCLSSILLYPQERLQFRDYTATTPSTIYGADHLLRLLVKLPYILKESNLSSDKLKILQQFLLDLMKWLQTHKEVFSLYVSMSLHYMNELENVILFDDTSKK